MGEEFNAVHTNAIPITRARCSGVKRDAEELPAGGRGREGYILVSGPVRQMVILLLPGLSWMRGCGQAVSHMSRGGDITDEQGGRERAGRSGAFWLSFDAFEFGFTAVAPKPCVCDVRQIRTRDAPSKLCVCVFAPDRHDANACACRPEIPIISKLFVSSFFFCFRCRRGPP